MSTSCGRAHRGRHALEPAHRAQAHVQVELAAQGHVERAHAAAHRGGEGAFDADLELGEGLQGLIRQPGIRSAGWLFRPAKTSIQAIWRAPP